MDPKIKLNLFRSVPPSRLETVNPSVAFVIKLGSALHKYGAPAHRLEETMSLMLQKLSLEGQFFSTPTGIFVSFGGPEEQRTSLIRVEPGNVDLGKMTLIDNLAGQVLKGEIGPAEGALRIDEIAVSPSPYHPVLTAFCFGIASATAARFFGGGWREIAASALIGLILGSLSLLSSRSQTLSRVYEPVAAFFASALAASAAAVFSPMSVYVTTLAGLITLLPGFALTVAMTELATKNLVSGTARLTGAILAFLQIGFGVALGTQIVKLLPLIAPKARTIPLPGWTEWAALLIAPLAFTVLFKARPRDVGWIVIAGLISFEGARLGAHILGPEFGACIGALFIGMGSNLYARFLRRPAAVMTVPGLILLVPGSVGFGSFASFLQNDVISGVEAAFKMALVAVSLVAGLLMANVTVPPRKAL